MFINTYVLINDVVFVCSVRWIDAFIVRDELHSACNCSFSWWSMWSNSCSFRLLEMVFNSHTLCVCFCQDIASKVLSFSQQGPRATCVLSVSGAVSTATILQPSPSQGAIKYEVWYLFYPHVLLWFTRQINTTHVCYSRVVSSSYLSQSLIWTQLKTTTQTALETYPSHSLALMVVSLVVELLGL